jgi:hypothetical protein
VEPPGKPKPPYPPGDRRALVEAYRDVVKSEAERLKESRTPRPPVRTSRKGRILAAVIVVVGAAILIAQPAWLTTPPAVEESPEVREASLRLAIYQAAEHIDAYERANERLPGSLKEAGAELSSLKYEVVGPRTYVLAGQSGDLKLEYRSEQPLQDFLGNSYEIIRKRFKP